MKNLLEQILARLPSNTHTILVGIFLVYLGSSLLHVNPDASSLKGLPHFRLSYLVLAPPGALSGDEPHYLVSINSLLEDADFDLSNNYRQAANGDWDAGARFRGKPLEHHSEVDALGRERSTHSPYFALLLAALCWPFRGSRWVESAAILWTLLVSVLGLRLLATRVSSSSEGRTRLLILGLASPLWSYSRELWTEPWVMTLWILLLVERRPALLFLAGCLGSCIKYPFLCVPLSLGAVELATAFRTSGDEKQQRIRRGTALCGSALSGLVLTLALIQWLFRDVDHFSFFHSGIHAGFGLPGWSLLGLWLDPRDGLFFFFPLLLLGLTRWKEWKAAEWIPFLAFFLVHACYQDWRGGTGFSSRYLVPALPLLAAHVPLARQRIWWLTAFGWSLLWGAVGGVLPALVYDRTPWGVVAHIIEVLGRPGLG